MANRLYSADRQNISHIREVQAHHTGDPALVLETLQKIGTFDLLSDADAKLANDVGASVNAVGSPYVNRTWCYLVRFGMLIERQRWLEQVGALYGDTAANQILATIRDSADATETETAADSDLHDDKAPEDAAKLYDVVLRMEEDDPGLVTLDNLTMADLVALIEIGFKSRKPPIFNIGRDEGAMPDEPMPT